MHLNTLILKITQHLRKALTISVHKYNRKTNKLSVEDTLNNINMYYKSFSLKGICHDWALVCSSMLHKRGYLRFALVVIVTVSNAS